MPTTRSATAKRKLEETAQAQVEVAPKPGSESTFEMLQRRSLIILGGKKFNADREANKLHGRYKWTNSSGREYDLTYVDNKRHGRQVFIGADGGRVECEYKDGVQHGWETTCVPSPEGMAVTHSEYAAGKKVGVSVTRWADGNVQVSEYANDVQHGNSLLWHRNTTNNLHVCAYYHGIQTASISHMRSGNAFVPYNAPGVEARLTTSGVTLSAAAPTQERKAKCQKMQEAIDAIKDAAGVTSEQYKALCDANHALYKTN